MDAIALSKAPSSFFFGLVDAIALSLVEDVEGLGWHVGGMWESSVHTDRETEKDQEEEKEAGRHYCRHTGTPFKLGARHWRWD